MMNTFIDIYSPLKKLSVNCIVFPEYTNHATVKSIAEFIKRYYGAGANKGALKFTEFLFEKNIMTDSHQY
jgi:hypothetical protein